MSIEAHEGDIIAYKTTDESVSSSTILQDDDEIVVAVAANSVYAFQFYLRFNMGSSEGIQFGWSVPSGTTMSWFPDFNSPQNELDQTAVESYSALTGNSVYPYVGYIKTSSTAGNVTFRWAQDTSGATNTTVLAGTYLVLRKIN